MELNKENKKIKKYIFFLIFVLVLSVIFFIMLKYKVEGEKNIPFKVSKIMIISSAETEELEKNEDLYQAKIIQKNDIYLAIEKNEKYKKQDAIKKIIINNFNTIKNGKIGNVKIYRTAKEEKKYDYKDVYEINDKLEFLGDLNTNLKMDNMTIANQGGILEFSIILNDLGKITYEENENIISDGTLLNRIDLTTDDIKIELSFDMLIELESGNTFKTSITLELPEGNINEQGVCTNESIDINKLVFKRV